MKTDKQETSAEALASGETEPRPIPVASRIEKAAAGKTSYRPGLQHPYLRISEKKTGRGRNIRTKRMAELQASDSYCAATIALGEADPSWQEGRIPVEVITFARKHKAGIFQENNRFVIRADQRELASFPACTEVSLFPDFAQFQPKGTPVVSVGLNPTFLSNLAVALGAPNGVRLDIYEPLKPFGVTPLIPGDAHGMLMPIRIVT